MRQLSLLDIFVKSIAILGLCTMSLAYAADNPYLLNYTAEKPIMAKLTPEADAPIIYRGVNVNEDNANMFSQGYDLIGSSRFVAGEVAPELLTEQAKKVKADIALIYTANADKTPVSVKIQQMRDAAKASKGGVIEVDEKVEYQYTVSYWAKIAPPKIGVHVAVPATKVTKTDPKQEEKKNVIKTTGLRVLVVVGGSAADNAGVVNNDFLQKIGDVKLENVEQLAEAGRRYAGQTVPLISQRGDEIISSNITIAQ